MAKEKGSFVVGVFEDSTKAQQALEELRHAGFRDDQIRFSKPGVATGSLSNDLLDMGVPQGEARFYEQELAAGRTIVTVIAAGRHQDVLDIMARSGATNVPTRPAQQHLTEPEGDLNIQLREEQLRANKHVVERGEVGLRKEVVSEQQTLDVPVTHEEVYIERRPGSGQVSNIPVSEGETIRVPTSEEQVTTSKQTVETGEITLGKRQVQEMHQVSDTVQREEARIERAYNEHVQGNTEEGVTDQPNRPL